MLQTDKATALGYHWLADLKGCDPTLLNNTKWLEKNLLELCKQHQLSVVRSLFHEFSPIGVTGVLVLEESHLAIHTWPEHDFLALDIFTCGQYDQISNLIDNFSKLILCKNISISEIKRGDINLKN